MSNRVVAAAGAAAVATYAAVAASLLALPPFVVEAPAVRTAQVQPQAVPLSGAVPVRAMEAPAVDRAPAGAGRLPPA
ncbi:hypothetical protein GCM10008171_25740 [Methylopila jiangsuensis]|uniref:Uncharacterized protein n=1 Tax=Methylopila jiangsuensis TaxID=586230 RepID=A0A9W6N4G0_9HYPH|nr:hypothetical protein [Methylopila jiangsuensis]MDR6285289.1 hypothetical protein [Methylopila jiangsuensis]GLK77320.1 hypothetical protein GCM10008171_25740 [Methylopila jiangsuensis]